MVPTMETTAVPLAPAAPSGAPDTALLLDRMDAELLGELRLETNRARQVWLTRMRCLVDAMRGPGEPVG